MDKRIDDGVGYGRTYGSSNLKLDMIINALRQLSVGVCFFIAFLEVIVGNKR